MKRLQLSLSCILLLMLACNEAPPTYPGADSALANDSFSGAGWSFADTTDTVPIIDLATSTYKGFTGGLYDGTNDPPLDLLHRKHRLAGLIEPLDSLGNPDPNGKIVFVSATMSNGQGIWCKPLTQQTPNICREGSFMPQFQALPDRNPNLVLVSCCQGGQALQEWANDPEPFAECQRRLEGLGLTMAQVQIVWTIVVRKGAPSRPLMPDPDSDAVLIQEMLPQFANALQSNFLNARMLYLQSRAYSWRHEPTGTTPHPWEYEAYYGAKWFIQERRGRGALGVFHGPYIYANGLEPRSDGLTWPEDHVREDGIHPSYPIGVTHIADLMIEFFRGECWFLDGGCG